MDKQTYILQPNKDPLHPKDLHKVPQLSYLNHELHKSNLPKGSKIAPKSPKTAERIKNKLEGAKDSVRDEISRLKPANKSPKVITEPKTRRQGSEIKSVLDSLDTTDVQDADGKDSTSVNSSKSSETKSLSFDESKMIDVEETKKLLDSPIDPTDQNDSLRERQDSFEKAKKEFEMKKKEKEAEEEDYDSDGTAGTKEDEMKEEKSKVDGNMESDFKKLQKDKE